MTNHLRRLQTLDSRSKTFVVSAPSGTGKTTLNRRLLSEFPQVEMSISHTTRPPRPGEVDGQDYHFIAKDDFEAMVRSQAFLEWALVHGNLYGTSRSELERIRNHGHAPLLEIDVQGWLQARQLVTDAVSIFILPPSLEVLWERLAQRGSDSLRTRWLRLQNALHEIEKANHYRYFIVNHDLEIAYCKLKSIIVDGEEGDIDARNGLELCRKLHDEFQSARWIRKLEEELLGG